MFMGEFNAKTSKDDVFANDNQRQFTKLDYELSLCEMDYILPLRVNQIK